MYSDTKMVLASCNADGYMTGGCVLLPADDDVIGGFVNAELSDGGTVVAFAIATQDHYLDSVTGGTQQ